MPNRWFTLPNLFSEFRIVAAPFLLILAWNGYPNWFLGLLALAFLTDAVDGYLARKLHETSELGAQLDSWGDLITYISIPVCIWWLWPEVIRRETWFIVIVLTAYLVPMIIGLAKFHALPSYHTWIAKTAMVMMSASVFAMLVFEYPWAFRFFAVAQILVSAEEIAITLTLKHLRSNVRSYWHVRMNKQI